MFDVTMGSYDEVEICLSTVIDRSVVGLYWDNGLAAINNANGPKLDSIRISLILLHIFALIKEELSDFQSPSKSILSKHIF